MAPAARLALLAVLVSSCGDNQRAAPPVALEDLGDSTREAVCDWATRCRHVPDRPTCERLIDPKDYDVRRAVDAVAAGRLIYDPFEGGQCVVDNREQGCLAGTFSSRACREMFVAAVEEGGACTSSFECEGDCEELACEGQCCLGVCGPAVAVDIPDPKGAGGACTSHFDCDGSSYCETNGRCTLLPENPGDRCLFGCAFGDLYCDLDTLSCMRFAGLGEVCDPAGANAPPCDEAWSFCEETCKARPGIGDACSIEGARCVPTAFCDGARCQARGAPGDPCTDGDQCEVACDTSAGECLSYATCRT